MVMPVSACQFDDQGHWVRMQFIDTNGTPMVGMVIVKQQVYDDVQTLWIMSMFGITPVKHEKLKEEGSYHTLSTNSEGYVEAPMFEAMKYNITFYNRTTYEKGKTYVIYPRESDYIFTIENRK